MPEGQHDHETGVLWLRHTGGGGRRDAGREAHRQDTGGEIQPVGSTVAATYRRDTGGMPVGGKQAGYRRGHTATGPYTVVKTNRRDTDGIPGGGGTQRDTGGEAYRRDTGGDIKLLDRIQTGGTQARYQGGDTQAGYRKRHKATRQQYYGCGVAASSHGHAAPRKATEWTS